MIKRINLWSSPRNISTALMYSFAQRMDTRVFDEPFYAYYLTHSERELNHPGIAEVLNSLPHGFDDVLEKILYPTYDKPVLVFKQMTHHLIERNYDFMLDMENVLLIRDPAEIIHSYSKVIETPQMEDIGVEQQLELFDFLIANDVLSAVIDTNELLKNPRKVLGALCTAVGIPFDENMLTWNAGPRPEDGSWAPFWYDNVHKSTGFGPPKTDKVELKGVLKTLEKECRPYYDAIFEFAIKS
jgi:hypothetical protein